MQPRKAMMGSKAFSVEGCENEGKRAASAGLGLAENKPAYAKKVLIGGQKIERGALRARVECGMEHAKRLILWEFGG